MSLLKKLNCVGKHKEEASGPAELIGRGLSDDRLARSGISCPECGGDMFLLNVMGQDIDICRSCRGLWFDNGELMKFTGASRDLPSLGFRLRSRESDFKCPVCGEKMEEHVFAEGANLLVDICREDGIFLQGGELERAMALV